MSASKVKVLVTDTGSLFEGYPDIERLYTEHVEMVHISDIEGNPALAQGVKVAFYCGAKNTLIFDYKEKGLLPDLGLVCNHGAGVNHMPFARLKEMGLRLTNTPEVLSDCTADEAFGLMIASGRLFAKGRFLALPVSLPFKIMYRHEDMLFIKPAYMLLISTYFNSILSWNI